MFVQIIITTDLTLYNPAVRPSVRPHVTLRDRLRKAQKHWLQRILNTFACECICTYSYNQCQQQWETNSRLVDRWVTESAGRSVGQDRSVGRFGVTVGQVGQVGEVRQASRSVGQLVSWSVGRSVYVKQEIVLTSVPGNNN